MGNLLVPISLFGWIPVVLALFAWLPARRAVIVQHERNGLLCRPGDPQDLAEKILTLLDNRELAAQLGAQAAEDAESRYHPDLIARQTIEFYEEVLARWHRERGQR